MRDHGCYLIAPVPVERLEGVVATARANGELLMKVSACEMNCDNCAEELSQLHDRSATHLEARTLRAYLGDFTHSESLPKMMSRIGQCFSQALVHCSFDVPKEDKAFA